MLLNACIMTLHKMEVSMVDSLVRSSHVRGAWGEGGHEAAKFREEYSSLKQRQLMERYRTAMELRDIMRSVGGRELMRR